MKESYLIIINQCYGSFTFSDEAIELYKLKARMCKEGEGCKSSNRPRGGGPNCKNSRCGGCDYINKHSANLRSNKDMIDIFKDIGSKRMSGSHAELTLEEIPVEYKHYYSIDQYDGYETLKLNTESLVLDLIKDSAVKNNYKEISDIFEKYLLL